MDFLKEILGDDLFNQVSTAINAWNDNDANKDKLVKLANLSTGEYVSKGKYDGLVEQLTGKQGKLDKANGLISELQKATKGNEELQGKTTDYEAKVADLQTKLAETKMKSAIKVALLSEKAVDVDYLTFKLHEKLKEKGETLELDENDNIKGWEAQLEGLKTQFPNMFEAGRKKVVDPNKLPDGDPDTKAEPKSLEEALRLQYEGNNGE